VPSRSGDVFAELIQLLQGYPVNVKDERHRAELLRDARYFHFKGLEQRLIPCDISYNLMRKASEIVIRLEDIRQSGITFTQDSDPETSSSASNDGSGKTPASTATSPSAGALQRAGYVTYGRPYVDEQSFILIVELSSPETTRLHLSQGPDPSTLSVRATFVNQTLSRITSLFSVIANKMGLPATQPLGLMMLQSGGGVAAQPVSPANSGISGERVKVRIDSEAYIQLDGEDLLVSEEEVASDQAATSRKLMKRRRGSMESEDEAYVDAVQFLEETDEISWVVRKGHWRLRVVPVEETGRMEVVMHAVRVEAFSNEKARNACRGFIG
jgi:hypothetical protein